MGGPHDIVPGSLACGDKNFGHPAKNVDNRQIPIVSMRWHTHCSSSSLLLVIKRRRRRSGMFHYRSPLAKHLLTSLLIFSIYSQVLAQVRTDSEAFYGLPAGTRITVRMDNEINSVSSSVDDTFTATVSEPVKVDGDVVLPTGIVLEGRVTKAKKAAIGRKDGVLEVRFETLYLDRDRKRAIEGVLEPLGNSGHSSSFDLLAVLGGAAGGGLIGTAAGSGKGTLIGAGLGIGVGLGAVLFKKGADVHIAANEEFRVRLTKPVPLPAKGF